MHQQGPEDAHNLTGIQLSSIHPLPQEDANASNSIFDEYLI